MPDNDNQNEIDAKLAQALNERKALTNEERQQLERERRSAAAIARRARQIHDACCEAGLDSDQIIAAAIVADRLEDLQSTLHGVSVGVDDIHNRLMERDR